MRPSVKRLMDRYYPAGSDGRRFRDGTHPFYDWILASVNAAEARVLNVGAGPAEPTRNLRGRVGWVVGVDPDPVVLTNANLDEAHVNDGAALPFPEASFDAVYCDWTLEHVAHPKPFLAEIFRVVKPGAAFWFRTTNRRHYVNFVAANTPLGFHKIVANRARGFGSSAWEPWPTHYRMNRERTLRRHLVEAGFANVEIRMMESHPSYLVFHPVPFLLGVAYERFVNRFGALSPFRQLIIGRAVRPSH